MCPYPPYARARGTVAKSADVLRYHNGAEWPYLSGLYAYARLRHGLDPTYPATAWFRACLERGVFTPVEYHSPGYPAGPPLQGWSGVGALPVDHPAGDFFDRPMPAPVG